MTTATAVFIRIPKTAGTSLVDALDVQPQILNNARDRFLTTGSEDWGRRGLSVCTREALGASWDDLLRFAFVRNPWDRAVSSWKHVTRRHCGRRPFYRDCLRELRYGRVGVFLANAGRHRRYPRDLSFESFLVMVRDGLLFGDALWHTTPQHVHLLDHAGEQTVEFVGRFEQLQADFDSLCDRLGIARVPLPHKNPSRRTNYKDHYDRTCRQLVERIYRRDIEEFGYSF